MYNAYGVQTLLSPQVPGFPPDLTLVRSTRILCGMLLVGAFLVAMSVDGMFWDWLDAKPHLDDKES